MKTKHKHWAALTASTLGLTGLSLASTFGDEKYTYDASGNVLEKQIGDQVTRYDYTGNQLNGSNSDSGRKQYGYDSSGRLTSDSEAGKPTRNLEHQYLDKVTKVKNGDKTTEFFYNAEGQLVGTNSAGTSETFAWDGLGLVTRGDSFYIIENHISGGVPTVIGDQVIVSDFLGSTLSAGDKVFEQLAFGNGLEDGFFTGKPFVSGIEGFVFKYRNYSSTEARWISSDPSGYPDGSNNLAYASCPTTSLDLFGLLDFANAQNTSLSVKVSHGSGAEWWADIWKAKTDDGASTVDMYKFQSLVQAPQLNPYNLVYNCHGYVHGGSQYWINDDMSPRIILGDGWKEINETDVLEAGGPYIATFFVSAHSAKVTEWVDGDVIKVTDKGGVTASPRVIAPEGAWNTGPIQFYEK